MKNIPKQIHPSKKLINNTIYDIETIFGEWFITSDYVRDELSDIGKHNLAEVLENFLNQSYKEKDE